MKLQKATQFGLYAVLELARDPQSQKSAVDIAKKYGISSNHLAKVLRDLGRAGFVESVRGAGGGYRFSGNSKRVTLMDVISIFEELGSDVSSPDNITQRVDIEDALLSVLFEIDEITQATFSSITLDTLLKTIYWRGQK
ncbi:MAG: transcriptional regulator [Rhodospirillaceae bacterium]|nr:transcriptional regulator [Rhodospirillaceae bacterium]OUT76491.1 MAG: transcriptional regulator [Rhodospirillaceae bacterium TMED23]